MRSARSQRADTLGLRRVSTSARRGPAGIVAVLLGLVTLIGTVAIGGGWRLALSAAQSVTPLTTTEAAPRIGTLLSARRLPVILSDDVRIGSLRTRLSEVASRLEEGSCLRVELGEEVIVDTGGNQPLMPASVVKLLTASVALDVLGPEHRFVTSIHGRVLDGRIIGPLYVVGGGDPVLVSPGYSSRESQPTLQPTRIDEISTILRAAGVNAITSGVVGVEGRYDQERYSPDLALGVRGMEVGPLGSLMVNDGWVLGDPIKPSDPTLAAAREFSAQIAASGISVAGAPSVGVLPTDLPAIGELRSAPLSTLIVDMLSNSDNNTAELLLKEIGRVVTGTGSRTAGTSVVVRRLAEWGVDTSGVTLVDGSGLERANRLTCQVLAVVLERDGGFGFVGSALAIPGERGTLRGLLTDTQAGDRLRGKTGTLTGAKSLAGFVRYTDSDALRFVLIANGPLVANQASFLPIWQRLANSLGAFSTSPTAEEIRGSR